MRILKPLVISCLLLVSFSVTGQQLPLYGQYMMNGFLINPAIAGSDGYTAFNFTTRDHWAGIEQSPKTYALSFQSRILWQKVKVKKNPNLLSGGFSRKSGRVGVGGYVFSDNNALINRTGAQFSYAYHIFIKNTQLSFGLGASTFQVKIDESKLTFRESEPILADGFDNLVLVPDFSFGMYLLNKNNFLGVSAAQLFQTRIKIGSRNVNYRMKRHYYVLAGHQFNIGDNSEIEPSILMRGTEIGIVQADLNLKYIYKEFYWIGVSYRTQTSVGFLIGGKANRFYFGYAFDYNLTDIGKYSYGSHELNLSIKFGDSSRRYRWLKRY